MFATFSGCRTPTQLTVEVTTDVPCAEIRGTTITVSKVLGLESTRAASTSTTCVGGRIGALVVVPSGARNADLAIKVVTGVRSDPAACAPPSYAGCMVARRALRFLEHDELLVPVVMRRSCLDVPCGEDQTCVQGKCVSATVEAEKCKGAGCDEATLSPGDAGVDAGDAATDTDADTGTPITGDTRGLLAGSPWPMLNGSPTQTGSTKWALPATTAVKFTVPAPAAASAIVVGADGLVIYGNGAEYVAIDPVTKAQKWSTPITGGTSGDPAYASDGVLYVPGNTALVGLEPATGKVVSTIPISVPGDVTIGPGPIVYLAGRNGVGAVDPAAKKVLWVVNAIAMDPGPALSTDGKVYVGTLDGFVRQYDAKTGAPGWTFTAVGPVRAPIIAGENGLVYAASHEPGHKVQAIDVATGKQAWEADVGAAVEYSFARGADGHLYVGTQGNLLVSLDAKTGGVRWSRDGKAFFHAPMVVDRNGILAAAVGDEVVFFDTKADGAVLRRTPLVNVLAFAPAGDGMLYAVSVGALTAYGP